MGEIKAQMMGTHQRTLLLHMLTQYGTQGFVQQMGGSMVAGGVLPAGNIDLGNHRTRQDLSAGYCSDMDKEIPALDHITHFHLKVVIVDLSGISHLSARLSVERGLV